MSDPKDIADRSGTTVFGLVNAIAKRAKQLRNGALPRVTQRGERSEVALASIEFDRGLFTTAHGNDTDPVAADDIRLAQFRAIPP